MKERIIITGGDPAGCGASIILESIKEFANKRAIFYLVGDKRIFNKYPLFPRLASRIEFVDLSTKNVEKSKIGFPSKISGQASLSYLNRAIEIIKSESIKKLVTAPISKEAVQKVFLGFCGHTEFLADKFKVKEIGMMMACGSFRVVLLTRHIKLIDVPKAITKKLVRSSLTLVYDFLKNTYKIASPEIVLASLNPHAGLDTFLEREEKTMLSAIKTCKFKVSGPYPGDTLFLKNKIKKFDCIIVGYHDAAMIPFKMSSFSDGVNVTIGLPIVRTSPAHGTAFDLMRKRKKPMHNSMLAAIKLACKLSV